MKSVLKSSLISIPNECKISITSTNAPDKEIIQKENSKKNAIGESRQTISYLPTALVKWKTISDTRAKMLRRKLTLLEMSLKYQGLVKRSPKRHRIRKNSYCQLTLACSRSLCWVKTKAMSLSLPSMTPRRDLTRQLIRLRVSKLALASPSTTWRNLRHLSSRITLILKNHETNQETKISVELVPALSITETRTRYSERQIDHNHVMAHKGP